jgi:predicted MFS family arabinose efflux permease
MALDDSAAMTAGGFVLGSVSSSSVSDSLVEKNVLIEVLVAFIVANVASDKKQLSRTF